MVIVLCLYSAMRRRLFRIRYMANRRLAIPVIASATPIPIPALAPAERGWLVVVVVSVSVGDGDDVGELEGVEVAAGWAVVDGGEEEVEVVEVVVLEAWKFQPLIWIPITLPPAGPISEDVRNQGPVGVVMVRY